MLFADDITTGIISGVGGGVSFVGTIYFLMRWMTSRLDSKDTTIQEMMTVHNTRIDLKDTLHMSVIERLQQSHEKEQVAMQDAHKKAMDAFANHCKEEIQTLFNQLIKRMDGTP